MGNNHYTTIAVDLDSTLADTPAIAVGPFESGTFICPASMTQQNIEFHVSDTETGTYNQLASATEVKVVITAATQAYAYPIPTSALDGVKWLKICPATNDVAGVRLTFN